ncbi:MAG: hypothetical protein QM689_09445 [Oscillospiraceae bacterium]
MAELILEVLMFAFLFFATHEVMTWLAVRGEERDARRAEACDFARAQIIHTAADRSGLGS